MLYMTILEIYRILKLWWSFLFYGYLIKTHGLNPFRETMKIDSNLPDEASFN